MSWNFAVECDVKFSFEFRAECVDKILRRYALSARDLKMEFSSRILQTRCQIATASNKGGGIASKVHRYTSIFVSRALRV